MQAVNSLHDLFCMVCLQLKDMKKAIGVSFVLCIAAEVPAKGAQSGTELMQMCEGVEGLRAVLLDDEQIRLNSVPIESFYADQNGKAAQQVGVRLPLHLRCRADNQ